LGTNKNAEKYRFLADNNEQKERDGLSPPLLQLVAKTTAILNYIGGVRRCDNKRFAVSSPAFSRRRSR